MSWAAESIKTAAELHAEAYAALEDRAHEAWVEAIDTKAIGRVLAASLADEHCEIGEHLRDCIAAYITDQIERTHMNPDDQGALGHRLGIWPAFDEEYVAVYRQLEGEGCDD